MIWWKFFKSDKQQLADDPVARFAYGSLDGELLAGIPYPIFMILPRVFPDLVAKYATEGYGPQKLGFGGYGAFGLAWEEGQRLPFGLSIKRLGYERVTINCALCHTASYRLSTNDQPRFAIGGPAHTLNLQGLLRFLIAASHDERFSATRLIPEISIHFPMDWLDWADYATVLIPATRTALHLVEGQLGWMNEKPAWGPGRDDAFNLPKYILTQTPWDDTTGNTDFPAVWRLGSRKGQLYHSAGEAKSLYAVVATSAIGIGSLPAGGFVDAQSVARRFYRSGGAAEIPAHGRCRPRRSRRSALPGALRRMSRRRRQAHRHGNPARRDRHRSGTRPWLEPGECRPNECGRAHARRGRIADVEGAQGGYVARPLVGLWLLGPYLHNGSVPTLADLLSPLRPASRVFYRGYDVVDFDHVGFVSTGNEAEANGFRFDTGLRGNGNGGHLYGTDLGDSDKSALIEFLKKL